MTEKPHVWKAAMLRISKMLSGFSVPSSYQKLLAFLYFQKNLKLVGKISPRSTKMLITFDRMMAQKSIRHFWKAETLRISKMLSGFSVPTFHQK